jgi:hypothetical protein
MSVVNSTVVIGRNRVLFAMDSSERRVIPHDVDLLPRLVKQISAAFLDNFAVMAV